MSIVVFSLSVLALLMVLIALGVPLARFLRLPFPVIVAAVGLTYGTISATTDLSLSVGALDTWEIWFVNSLALDSDTILYVFLPPLLFEMALAVRVRRMMEELSVVILMAVFAVVVATAAIGFAVWALSPLGLVACLMLGAAIATTDPAAVITTFREIGAPRRLQVILEGESLLNDAAAIAIFTLLIGVATQEQMPTLAGALILFLYSFGVGGATGIIVAFLASRLYPLLGRSAVAEVSMTVALAYGSYLIAEFALGASGVVAVVCAGLTTSAVGFVQMGPKNWTTAQTVWTQIGFWANGLILLLVSSMTPRLLIDFTWFEALLLPVVYLAAFGARAVILFGLLPLIERLTDSERIERPQKLLVLWGGVRGAVTLVLALSLNEITAIGGQAGIVGALAAAFALATLIINASTLALMTRQLGLDQLSPGDLAIRERIVAGSIERVRNVVHNLAGSRALEPEAVEAVEETLSEQRRDVEAHTTGQRMPFGERLRLGLTILAAQESRLVRRGFDEGAIGPRATSHMRLIAERLADAARIGGRAEYEIAFEREVRSARAFRSALTIHRLTGWDRPLRDHIELRLTALLESERILRELETFCDSTLSSMIGADAAANLRELMGWRLERVNVEIDATSLQYPAYAAALERTLLARAAIRRERQQYERLFGDGVIGPELHDDLIRDVDKRERRLGRPPRLDLSLSPAALLERVPLLSGLNQKQRRMISRRLRTRLVAPEEVILAAGARSDEMFFIASGVVEVRGPEDRVTLSNGDFFGEIALVTPFRRRRSSVISLGFGRLLSLTRRDYNRLVKRDPSIEDVILSAARRQMAEGFRPIGTEREIAAKP